MGIFSSAWDIVKRVGGAVASVVKKVYEVCSSDSAVKLYDDLDKIVYQRGRGPLLRQSNGGAEPDFYAPVNTSHIEHKLSRVNESMQQYESDLNETKKITVLQIDLLRLRTSAELIDRSMKNLKMHALSLSVHFQNIRNINGLIDDVNTLRYGLKAVISTINHNANMISNQDFQLRRIEGVDIERTDGAISQLAAFDAFDRTREMLNAEIVELSAIAGKHLKDIQNLKSNAADFGGQLGSQIIQFVDRQIVPVVTQAESAGLLLRSEVAKLPAAVRTETGSLVFENGSIKLESQY